MTIARDLDSDAGSRGRLGGRIGGRRTGSGGNHAVPAELLRERLDRQVASFVGAGYRLETRAGLQAVMIRERPRTTARNGVLALAASVPSLLLRAAGGRPPVHRVVITVDGGGQVAFA